MRGDTGNHDGVPADADSAIAHVDAADTIDLATLTEPHELDAERTAEFDAKGHTVVRALAEPTEVAAVRPVVERLARRRAVKAGPLDGRDTYGQAFLQVANLWRHDPIVRRFVLAPRFAKVAADLLGVPAVRLYHDQMLVKEAGGGRTPWHQDQVYWPLDTDRTVTMWMPLVDIPSEVGTMIFASGSHRSGNLGEHLIGDDSDSVHGHLVERLDLSEETHGALRAGDATFHHGWTLHRAPPNRTTRERPVITIIYYADGARIGPVDTDARRFDQRAWLGNRPEGALADSDANPRLWPPP